MSSISVLTPYQILIHFWYTSKSMVLEIKKDNQAYFQCEECGFFYREKELAEKCQTWCKERHSCNLEITKHAIQLED